jgi:hypothetical protein
VLPDEVSIGADIEQSGWMKLNPRRARSAITSIFSGVPGGVGRQFYFQL